MKKLVTRSLFLFLVIFFTAACGNTPGQGNASGQDVPIDPANLQTIEVSVYGMTCEGCERAVQGAVGSLKGVKQVSASHTDSLAIVTYDKTMSSYQDIKAAIESKSYKAMGYKVSDTISK